MPASSNPTADLVLVPNIFYLPVERIEANPFQPRQSFSDAELDELGESIREHGVLQPILARPHPDREGWFQLVSGERRWRACGRIGRAQIPGTVRELSDLESAEIALQENIQRQSLSDFEEARGIERLWREYERAGEAMSKRAMARKLSMSVSFVSNRLDALGYKEDVQEMMGRHRNVLSSAKAINGIEDDTRRQTYIGLVEAGKSYLDVTASIQRDEMEIQAKAGTLRAPDAQTQARNVAVARGDSGAMSRGARVKGPSRAQANSEAKRGALHMLAHIEGCDDNTFLEVQDMCRRVVRGDLAR